MDEMYCRIIKDDEGEITIMCDGDLICANSDIEGAMESLAQNLVDLGEY